MSSQFVTWGLTLVLTVFLSRYLGASAVGKLYLADSLWAVAATLINFGMDTLLVKEVARSPARTAELFGTTVRLRCLFGVFGFGIVAFYGYLAGYPPETMYVVYIIGIASLISQCGDACRATLQGLERMEYIALGTIAGKAFATFVSIGLLLLGHGLLVIAAVTIGSALIYLLTQLSSLRRVHQLRFHRGGGLEGWMLKASLPYFMMSILLVAYQKVDVIIISLLAHDTMVGWYGAAEKLFGTLMFIPVLFVTAVFPALARMHAEASRLRPWSVRKGFQLLLILGVPIGLGMVMIADSLVLLLFGDGFAKSGPVLAIMGVAMIFTYQNILLGHVLLSTDRQYGLTVLVGLATLATIPLDIVLVPWCQKTFDNGAIGGALAYVITEAGVFIGCLRLLPKGMFGREQVQLYAPVLLVGLIMMVTTWWLRHLFIAIPVAFGAVTYGGLLVLLRILPQEDWRMLKNLGKDAFARLGMGKPAADWQA